MNPERTWIWVDVLPLFSASALIGDGPARTRVHPNRLKEKGDGLGAALRSPCRVPLLSASLFSTVKLKSSLRPPSV
jgi:hypothetical protein